MKMIIGTEILTEEDLFYKESVVYPANTTISKDAEYVKAYCGISEEFSKEIQKHFPFENELYIGFGIEKYFGVRLFHKEPQHPWHEGYEEEILEKLDDSEMPDFF